jgi:hypothetical protein
MMTLSVVALAATWLTALALLVLDLTGLRQRGNWFRWQGLGVLIATSAALTSAFAELRGLAASQLHPLRLVTDPFEVAGSLLLLVSILGQAKARDQRRNRIS